MYVYSSILSRLGSRERDLLNLTMPNRTRHRPSSRRYNLSPVHNPAQPLYHSSCSNPPLPLLPLSTGHPGEVECPPALSPDNLPDDLFAILFKCQSHSCPWRALLAHAIALQRPLLAILAACNQVCSTCSSASL